MLLLAALAEKWVRGRTSHDRKFATGKDSRGASVTSDHAVPISFPQRSKTISRRIPKHGQSLTRIVFGNACSRSRQRRGTMLHFIYEGSRGEKCTETGRLVLCTVAMVAADKGYRIASATVPSASVRRPKVCIPASCKGWIYAVPGRMTKA